MTTPSPGVPLAERRRRMLALVVFAGLTLTALAWAKWQPYGQAAGALFDSRTWSGTSVVDQAGPAGAAPNWTGAWSFTTTYFDAVWVALVAALLISAAVESLLPQSRLRAMLSRRGHAGSAVTGGLMAMPCMMCTCCTAPITSTLRRLGASTSAALAYWFGNPALNPAVLVFLLLVAPWQWAAARAVAGVVLVFGLSALIARLLGRPPGTAAPDPLPDPPMDVRSAGGRFLRSLRRMSLTLVPEYLVIVFAVGALRGWLFPLDGATAQWGVVAVVVAAVAGTLMVIPTGGEIPILLGLAAAGVSAAPLGALLITLPAISLPSMLMVGRALSWQVTAAAGAAVVVTGLGTAAMLAAIS